MPEAPTKRVSGKSHPEPRPSALKKAGDKDKDLEKNRSKVKFVEKPKDLKKQTVVSKGTKFEKKKGKAEEQLQQAAAAAAKKGSKKEKAEVTEEKPKKKERKIHP